jgi:DivIVA domain-containing protein
MPVEPSLSPEVIEAQAFATGFRGYDQAQVREFLGRVAGEVRAYRERNQRLESAWHSAEERAARPPVLDEDTLMAAVGDETATILRAARSAAVDLRTRAAADAERIISEAEAQGARIRADAEGVMGREVNAAQDAATRIVEAAKSEAAETLDKARTDADAIRAAAQQEKTLTIEGAISMRERVLEDLSRRRRVASVQIEQLRAGRERLLESYAVVRRTLEEVTEELSRADAEARAAADEVGRRLQREHPPEPHPAAEPAGEPEAIPSPSEEASAEVEPAATPWGHRDTRPAP